MIERIRELTAFKSAVEAINSNGKGKWLSGLWAASRCLVAAELAASLNRVLLFVTPTIEAAEVALGDLESFYDTDDIHFFPPREYLPPSDVLPPDQSISERLLTLRTLIKENNEARPTIIIAPAKSLLQYLPPPERILPMLMELRAGESWPLEKLSEALVDRGYSRQTMVETRGEFSIRGGIVDIYPICAETPYRLEFFGDEIDSIRAFDTITQRSFEKSDRMELIPRNRWIDSPGNMTERVTLLDYLPDDRLIVWDEPLQIEDEIGGDRIVPLHDTTSEELMAFPELIKKAQAPMICMSQMPQSSDIFGDFENIGVQSRSLGPLSLQLGAFIEELNGIIEKGFQAVIVCNNEGESKRLIELLQDAGMNPHFSPQFEEGRAFSIILGRLRNGFVIDEAGLVVASDQEIFRRYSRRRPRKKLRGGAPIAHFTDLRVGDFVVHVDHGIGVYKGLSYMPDQKTEFLILEYLDGDKLYVPVNMMHLVQKYVGSDDEPPKIYKLGGTAWFRVQQRVRRSIRDMAGELLDLHASRQVLPGVSFSEDSHWQGKFEEAFIYRETEDQLVTIDEIKRDMEQFYPMDRLICGDVGYGKTEMALRAAFKCVMDSRQVAVLVPTTILAQQHYTTFRERLADYPIRVEMLSRFRTRGEQKKILESLAEGKVDIIIGTHRLVQNDVSFSNLGLVVIDEEQRFGVAHKERLKKLRKMVDVLTLTATPIPRTLHMALMGVKDMSVINTAPEDRLSVVTVVTEFDDKLVREAILRELAREGQVFFVHNRVQTIKRMAGFLNRLAPEARYGVAHGQMNEHELQDTMADFLEKRIDVLVCTTIIESGLDIPNVNTMLINRADRFGLADLYQLRGRVGRYKHRAYAYLLIPSRRALSEVAQKRLKAIEEFSELGSGFKIALRDLEIRGAGNILGKEQHGDIAAVGFEMYCRLLEEAVDELKGEKKEKPLLPTAEFEMDCFIPDDYVTSPAQKLAMYKKIGLARTMEEINLIRDEMEDRYGPIPTESENLIETARLLVTGAAAGLEFIGKVTGDILFRPAPGKDFTAPELAGLSDKFGEKLRLETTNGIRLFMKTKNLSEQEILRSSIEVARFIAKLRDNPTQKTTTASVSSG